MVLNHQLALSGGNALELRRSYVESLGVVGFVFGMLGVVAFVRVEKLVKELKKSGVLAENYKPE